MNARSDKSEFLALLTAEQKLLFKNAIRQIRVRKNQTVVGQGAKSTDVFFVEEGTFSVRIFSPTGKEVSIRTLSEGEIFGELAAVDSGRRTADVVASSDGRVALLTAADFRTILEGSPAAALWLAKHFTKQIRTLTERIFQLSALDVRSRLHCELLRIALNVSTQENSVRIKDAPTHLELANRIGTHREAVTRELRELAKQSIVTQSKRELVIHDMEWLTRSVRRANGEQVGIVPAQDLPTS